MEMKDIVWLAGWLEGEGTFGFYYLKRNRNGTGLYSPQIRASSSDLDVIQRVGKILDTRPHTVNMANHIRRSERDPLAPKSRKQMYDCRISGARAAGWMMTLYTLMGTRRKDSIRKALERYRAIPNHGGSTASKWAAVAARKENT